MIDEVEEKPTAEVLKLKLEFEREERRLVHEEACEEAQRARKAAEAEAQIIEKIYPEIRMIERDKVSLY